MSKLPAACLTTHQERSQVHSFSTVLCCQTKKPLGEVRFHHLQEAKKTLSVIIYFTESFKPFPATNRGTLRAAMLSGAPV